MIRAVSAVLDFAPDHWTPAVRIVALALADRVNHEHQCWPSIADVCRRTGLSERSVQMHLRQLEREGVVDRVGRRSNGCGQPVSNLWIWRHWPDGGVQWAGRRPLHPRHEGEGCSPLHPNRHLLTTRENRHCDRTSQPDTAGPTPGTADAHREGRQRRLLAMQAAHRSTTALGRRTPP